MQGGFLSFSDIKRRLAHQARAADQSIVAKQQYGQKLLHFASTVRQRLGCISADLCESENDCEMARRALDGAQRAFRSCAEQRDAVAGIINLASKQRDTIAAQQQELSRLQLALKERDASVEGLNEELAALTDKYIGAMQNISEQADSMEGVAQYLKHIESELQQRDLVACDLSQRLEKANNENEWLKEQLLNKQCDIEDFTEQTRHYEALKDENITLAKQVEKLEHLLSMRDVQDATTQTDRCDPSIDTFCDSLRGKVELLKTSEETATNTISQLEQRVSTMSQYANEINTTLREHALILQRLNSFALSEAGRARESDAAANCGKLNNFAEVLHERIVEIDKTICTVEDTVVNTQNAVQLIEEQLSIMNDVENDSKQLHRKLWADLGTFNQKTQETATFRANISTELQQLCNGYNDLVSQNRCLQEQYRSILTKIKGEAGQYGHEKLECIEMLVSEQSDAVTAIDTDLIGKFVAEIQGSLPDGDEEWSIICKQAAHLIGLLVVEPYQDMVQEFQDLLVCCASRVLRVYATSSSVLRDSRRSGCE